MNHESKHDDHPAGPATGGKWRPHRDWRVWVGLLLMLAAMVAYVLTLDESWWPGG